MKSMAILSALVLLGSLTATTAFALDSSFEAMSQNGKHQFYVWCTGRADFVSSQDGNNAKAAQNALAQRAGGRCWPVWQGLAN